MAVELNCPKCKAMLRLAEMPDADAEIECAKCSHVFTTEEGLGNAAKAPEKKEEAKKVTAPPVQKGKKPKKKKGKKRKSNPVFVIGIVIGVVGLLSVVGVLVWLKTKKSASQEMMTYLPDDCDEVFGLNIGHLQKYPLFYESCEKAFASAGFRKAGELVAKANGAEFNATFDYAVYGTGRAGGKEGGQLLEATVLRTKVEFDPGILAKIPGAQKGAANGVTYYNIPDVPELGYPQLRVFAPTNRIVVFCRGDTPDGKFKAMLIGNKDNPDTMPYVRSGELGKYAIRGTVWRFNLYGRSFPKPAAPVTPEAPKGSQPAQPSDEDNLKKEIAEVAASAKGSAIKASVGSREIRGEWILWEKESSSAADKVKKWKEKDWMTDDDKLPPRWWKYMANQSGGGKTAENVLKDNLSFRASGELFVIRTAMDTKVIQQGVGGLISKFAPPPPVAPKPRRRRYITLARR